MGAVQLDAREARVAPSRPASGALRSRPMTRSIFDPVSFACGATSPNGFMLAPLTNGQSPDDGTLSDAERRWLVRRAAGGFGLVSTCAAHVSEDGKGFDGQLGVWGEHEGF